MAISTRTILGLSSASLLLLMQAAGCSSSNRTADKVQSAPPGIAPEVVTPAALQVDAPRVHANLAIFPILSAQPLDTDRFITLEEGLRDGTVEVTELGADSASNPASEAEQALTEEQDPFADDEASSGVDEADPFGGENALLNEQASSNLHVLQQSDASEAEVGRVAVLNRSDKPLYLMPGEIILGGQQDRCLAQETIIPPGEQPVTVAVFCVESGRWQSRTAEQLAALAPSAGTDPPTTLSLVISGSDFDSLGTHFIASAGALNKRGRLAVQASKQQGEVWEQVASANAAAGNSPATGTFSANYADDDTRSQLKPYVEALHSAVAQQDRVVGVIVAIDGKIEGADVFEATPLFRKLWPKLLQSYAFDAAHAGRAKGEDSPERKPASLAEAQAFLDELQQARVEATELTGGLTLTSRRSDTASIFSAETDAVLNQQFSGGLGGGGFGGAVHASAFAH